MIKKEILILFSCFPSELRHNAGIFNYRAYNQIAEFVNLKVVVVRSWRPFFREKFYIYNGIEVNVLYIPNIPYGYKSISLTKSKYVQYFFNQLAVLYAKYWIRNKYTSIDLIHSVDLGLNMLIGNAFSEALKIPHIGQAIGSDVNTFLPKLNKFRMYENWYKKLSGVICNSRDLEKKLKILSNGYVKTWIKYRGVNNLEYLLNPYLYEKNKDYIFFLFVGGVEGNETDTIGNLKGAEDLLKAWKGLESNFNRKFGTLLYGGPNSLSEPVKKFIKTLRYPENIQLLGELKPDDLKILYQKVDVVVIPSKEEGLPNVLLEAMASGCVIIANNVGGIPEVIDDGVNGLINYDNSINGLALLMKKIIDNILDINQIRCEARKKVAENFDSSSYGKSIFEIYSQVLYKL